MSFNFLRDPFNFKPIIAYSRSEIEIRLKEIKTLLDICWENLKTINEIGIQELEDKEEQDSRITEMIDLLVDKFLMEQIIKEREEIN